MTAAPPAALAAARQIIEAIPVYDEDGNCIGTLGETGDYSEKTVEAVVNAALNAALSPGGEREGDYVLVPKGWKLVPEEITLEMQRAYFDVIDRNLSRVQTDAKFGRFCSNKEAYRAMLAAAPAPPLAPQEAGR